MRRRKHTDDDLFPPTMGAPAPPAYRVRCVVCGQARPRVFLDGIELCELCAADDTQLPQARDAYRAIVAKLERQSERWLELIAELPQEHLERWQRITTAVMLGTDEARIRATMRKFADLRPYYDGLRERLQDQDAIFAQVAPASIAAFEACVRAAGGSVAVRGTESELIAAGLPPATECAYNHTTLQALKTDRGVTYLQVAYPVPFDPRLVAAQCERFGDEVLMHHEFSQAGGALTIFALPLVRYFDESQLRDLIASFEADGCLVFDPHTWVLEDGGMKQVDELQLAFKRQADPLGLMNPGKVRAWDERVLGIPGGTL